VDNSQVPECYAGDPLTGGGDVRGWEYNMTHCQSHQNICDLLNVFGIEIVEVVVKPRDQSRGAELKQGSRRRQKR
jgi:hypothetical protein